jgi:methyl-accepting chemotaxis protein
MKLKLATKINVLVLSIILVFAAVIGVVVNDQITKGIKAFATEKARADLALAHRYIDERFPGDWKATDGELYKGTTLMNDNFDLVDAIGEDTGDTVTIFSGDTRIATNVLIDGERAVGTQASEEVIETVITNGELYLGEANVVGNQYQTAYMPLTDASGQVIGMLYVGASQEFITETVANALTFIFIALLLVAVVASLAVYWFTRKMKKRLTVVTAALEAAGNGDFTTAIKDTNGDELSVLAESYNRMAEKLQDTLHRMIDSANQVASSSEQLTASAEQTSQATETITEAIQQVAEGSEKASASVEDASQSLETMAMSVHAISENANDISDISSQAIGKAKDGEVLVQQTVKQIQAINHSVEESGEVIKSLDTRSKEIGNITGVIASISEQTNLLALNAAIEAARAGEHGKGFTVVAEEVRKLAEQSQHSSAQIANLIAEIQEDMKRSNHSFDQVADDVEDGLRVIKETETNFQEILTFMEKLTDKIKQLVTATEDISTSTGEVAVSIGGVAQVSADTSSQTQNVAASTEEQLASMEEIASSAQALSQLAEELQQLMSQFKV